MSDVFIRGIKDAIECTNIASAWSSKALFEMSVKIVVIVNIAAVSKDYNAYLKSK